MLLITANCLTALLIESQWIALQAWLSD